MNKPQEGRADAPGQQQPPALSCVTLPSPQVTTNTTSYTPAASWANGATPMAVEDNMLPNIPIADGIYSLQTICALSDSIL